MVSSSPGMASDGKAIAALRHAESLARNQLEAEYKAEEQHEKADLKRRLEERKSQRKLLAATSDTAASAPATEARAASEPAAGDNPASADELDSETVDLAEAHKIFGQVQTRTR